MAEKPERFDRINAETEEEFIRILQIIFNAEKTRKVINSIIAQTK